jgi:superfamily I DNA/RNA helicase
MTNDPESSRKRERDDGMLMSVSTPSQLPSHSQQTQRSGYHDGSEVGFPPPQLEQPPPRRREPTPEQLAIVNSAISPQAIPPKGHIVRITAAAGTGKTTTMRMVADKLVQLDHDSVLYLVFNRAAERDAHERMPRSIGCSTIHAQAKRLLKFQDDHMKLMDDSEMIAFVLERMRAEMDDFLSTMEDRHKTYRMRRLVAFWIYKTLVRFMQSNDDEATGFDPAVFWTCYFPAVEHYAGKGRTKLPGEPSVESARHFFCSCAKKLWSWLRVDQRTKRSQCGRWLQDSVMKQVQVDDFTIREKVILVDESQDLTACQLWWIHGQRRWGKQIFFVGDPAQSIYSFRGAKSEYLANLPVDQDFKLTRSFRFGVRIAASANTILYGKMNSPQRKKFKRYDVVGGAAEPGQVCYHRKGTTSAIDDLLTKARQDGDQAPSVTLLAHRNSSLIVAALEYLLKYPDARIAAYGGDGEGNKKIKDWSDVCEQIEHLYALFVDKGNAHEVPLKGFEDEHGDYLRLTWNELIAMVDEQEMNNYSTHVSLITEYGVHTMDHVARFRERVLNARVDPSRCDVLLSTIHIAKGAEWPHVVILDDLFELARFAITERAEAEFEFKPFGDDINYWYVALTRAMRRVSVPVEFLNVVQSLDRAIEIADGHVSHSECMDPADGKFFLLPGARKYAYHTVLRIAALGRRWRRIGTMRDHAPVDIIDVDPIEDGVEPEPNEPSAAAADEREV